MADEITRSGAEVRGLFWLRRKPRSRERKWCLQLCVLLYIDTHRLPVGVWIHRTSRQLAAGRLQDRGWVTKEPIPTEGTGGPKWLLAFTIVC